MKRLIIPIITFLLIMVMVSAAGDKLIIDDIDVQVDGDKESGSKIEAKPGQEIEFEVKVENIFGSDPGFEIEDIDISLTVENIDDGDDIEEDLSDFDLSYGDSKKKEISFRVPYDADDDEFDTIIEVDGIDENGTLHKASATFTIEVEKDKHEIEILHSEVPTSTKCYNPILFDLDIVNLGENDEDVILSITNANIGLHYTTEFELDNSPENSDNRLQKLFKVGYITEDVVPGVYNLEIVAEYNDGDSESTSATVTILECNVAKKSSQTKEQPVKETIEVITQPTMKSSKVDEIKQKDNLPWAILVLVVVFVALMIIIAVLNARK